MQRLETVKGHAVQTYKNKYVCWKIHVSQNAINLQGEIRTRSSNLIIFPF